MASFLAAQLQLEVLDCAACRLPFGVPVAVIADRRRDHKTFYCPLGHSNFFPGKSEEDKLREQLTAARELAEREARRRRETADRAEHLLRSRDAYRGHLTRVKKRIAAGKCPACHQEFPDVATHVHDEHPGYVGD